jgi:membrane-bound serine protease (ClpP class)
VLPISWSGLGLILLGIALLVIDAFVVSHGALTVSGLVALGFGMVMLFHNAPAPYHTSIPIVVAFTVTLGLIWVFALTKAVSVRRAPVLVSAARVVGAEAVVRNPGQVYVEGELWKARREDGGTLVPGSHVRVAAMDGLELTVIAEE